MSSQNLIYLTLKHQNLTARFLLNDNIVAYLIHGQPFKLEYQTNGCWFIIISYDNGSSFFRRISLKKASGVFISVTNVYKPQIKVWGIGWGISKLFDQRLHINFINTRTQVMFAKTPDLPEISNLHIKPSTFRILFTRLLLRKNKQAELLSSSIRINEYDDFTTYKNHHPEHIKYQINYGK